jgi:signal transduction histidine kinase
MLLKEASESLEERVTQLSRIRDIIIHEIRNPLQIIANANYYVEMLKDASYEKASEEEKQLWKGVQTLQQGSDALKSVLETTSRLDMTELTIRLPVRLVEIIDEATTQAAHLLGDIQLDIKISDVGEQIVNCNKRMLVQVLVNLIRNATEAIQENEPPKPERIRITGELSNNREIILKVNDNGVGMEQQVVNNLFLFKFTTKIDGSGIGLHLSKMIMKLHEGSITVQSEKGVGTTFTLYLPCETTGPDPGL